MSLLTPTPRIISYDEWFAVRDCPIQRDTERHARKAVRKHLKDAAATHANVNAAELPDGTLYKLDGHTRAYLWKTGELKRPGNQLIMMVYRAQDLGAVKELYKQFDNASAAENIRDKLSGIFKSLGFEPESNAVKEGGVVSALAHIHSYNPTVKIKDFDVYQVVPEWLDEIKALDSLGAGRKQMLTGCIAAFFITYREYGEDALTFWHNYVNDLGVKNADGRDGVQAFKEFVVSKSDKRQNLGPANQKDILSRAISAFEFYRQDNLYTTYIKSTDVSKYLKRLKFFDNK